MIRLWSSISIGIIIFIVTSIIMHKLQKQKDIDHELIEIMKKFVAISTGIEGILLGIILAIFHKHVYVYEILDKEKLNMADIIIIMAAIASILGLYIVHELCIMLLHPYEEWKKLCLVVAIIATTISYCFASSYIRNIEETTETTLISKESRELLKFFDIPIQDISGSLSGGYGNIHTTDKISYWYLNQNDTSEYDTAPATESELIFIEDGKQHVEIYTYSFKEVSLNHNNNTKKVKEERIWKEYKFYLKK